MDKRKLCYLVKWRSFDDSRNTWVPKERLFCEELIEAFEAALKDNGLAETWVSLDKDGNKVTSLPNNIRRFMLLFGVDEGPAVSVFNDIDDSGPPENFTAITRNIFREGVVQPETTVKGCRCDTGCRSVLEDKCGCNARQKNLSLFPTYTRNGRLKLRSNLGVYECNSRCACPPSCRNRTVQNGRQGGGAGPSKNQEGCFIMEYVGEVITSDEAELRGVTYDAQQASYLFDLDYEHGHNEDCTYTIDACFYGNPSHFFNHSCDPNLAVFPIFIDSYSSQLYRLAFFAIHDIEPYDELTFDYLPQAQTLYHPNPAPPTKYKCYCEAKGAAASSTPNMPPEKRHRGLTDGKPSQRKSKLKNVADPSLRIDIVRYG
ncbi:hypothetical protein L0F63_004198 [Massospora cicadina]|nr:hypothetical protein L0F63_004198 [Massospora cicadina]